MASLTRLPQSIVLPFLVHQQSWTVRHKRHIGCNRFYRCNLRNQNRTGPPCFRRTESGPRLQWWQGCEVETVTGIETIMCKQVDYSDII